MPEFEGKIMTTEEILSKPFVYVVGKTLADRPEILPEKSIFQDDSTGFQYWVVNGKWEQANFSGPSTDEKPLDCVSGAHFYEEDTKDTYKFDGKDWTVLPKPEPVADIAQEEAKVTPTVDGTVMIEKVEREYVAQAGVWKLVKETIIG